MMSSHYEKQEPLPADLIEKIIKRCELLTQVLVHPAHYDTADMSTQDCSISVSYSSARSTLECILIKVSVTEYCRSLFPLLITFTEAVDYTTFWNELRESLSLVKSGKFTAGEASFNHLAGGYDAGALTHLRRCLT
jgi:Zn-dependent oligopeptidase